MKKILTAVLLSFLAFSASATIHIIEVKNNFYSPSVLSVNQGDTVRFKWVAGNHPTQSTNNMFSTFGMDNTHQQHDLVLAPGTYPYHCIPHQAQGMTGTITVNAVSSSFSFDKKSDVSVFPNPASDQVTVNHSLPNIDAIRITNMIGQQVKLVKPQFGSTGVIIPISDLPKGIYMVNLQAKGSTVFTQRLVKDR